MKNILVCIKQVPDTTEIRIDPVKKTLIREGVPSIVNHLMHTHWNSQQESKIKNQVRRLH